MNTSEERQAAGRIAGVVRGVVAAAVREAAAPGVIVLQDWTAEGELLYEWLVQELGEARVWRAASLASNLHVQGGVSGQLAGDDVLTAHPLNKTALLLGGRPPYADLLPLGDVWAWQVEALTGRWSAPAVVESLAARAGGVRRLDAALTRLVDDRQALHEADLDGDWGAELTRLYERGRFFRLRPRLVPKLTNRTVGIDLFD